MVLANNSTEKIRGKVLLAMKVDEEAHIVSLLVSE